MFSLIVACNNNNGIGKDNRIPWKCSEDMKFFAATTANSTVLVGANTWKSMGPLANRCVVVISSKLVDSRCTVYRTVEQFVIDYSKKFYDKTSPFYLRHCYVAGGPALYDWFTSRNLISRFFVTRVNDDSECTVYYNPPDLTYNILSSSMECTVYSHITRNVEEEAFLALMRRCLTATYRVDRTLTGCYSVFGASLSFDCSKGFPLLTTRKMFLRGVFEELMFMLRGQTDSTILEKKGVFAWKLNTTREFLDSHGLQHLPTGDIGPSYGFCMRHYGAKYVDCRTDYTGQGVDQLMNVVNLIKKNPTSRRMIINLYDPTVVDDAPLPPCLFCYQFYVDDGALSLQMTQRSSDVMIAGGWNIATGALLLHLVATECNLSVGKLIWNIGDIHVYSNIVDACKLQLTREPNIFPQLYITRKPLLDYEYQDLTLVNYQYHPHIPTVQSA